jgi:PIN domain nuclease of toxin-antitoxin system
MNPQAFLLGSHGLLWCWFDPLRLSPATQALLMARTNKIQMNAATVWVLGLKFNRDKVPGLVRAAAYPPGLVAG